MFYKLKLRRWVILKLNKKRVNLLAVQLQLVQFLSDDSWLKMGQELGKFEWTSDHATIQLESIHFHSRFESKIALIYVYSFFKTIFLPSCVILFLNNSALSLLFLMCAKFFG